jgi:hypothetical protein
MRAIILFVFSTFFIFVACKGKTSRPSDVLAPEKFQSVVWDLIRADHFISSYEVQKDSTLNKTVRQKIWYGRVLAYHKVSEEVFKKSMNYYQSTPSELSQMMDSLSHKTETPIFQTKKVQPAVVN